MGNPYELKEFTLAIQEKLKSKIFSEILDEAIGGAKLYENIPVINCGLNKPLSRDEVKKILEFQGNLQGNDYSNPPESLKDFFNTNNI